MDPSVFKIMTLLIMHWAFEPLGYILESQDQDFRIHRGWFGLYTLGKHEIMILKILTLFRVPWSLKDRSYSLVTKIFRFAMIELTLAYCGKPKIVYFVP